MKMLSTGRSKYSRAAASNRRRCFMIYVSYETTPRATLPCDDCYDPTRLEWDINRNLLVGINCTEHTKLGAPPSKPLAAAALIATIRTSLQSLQSIDILCLQHGHHHYILCLHLLVRGRTRDQQMISLTLSEIRAAWGSWGGTWNGGRACGVCRCRCERVSGERLRPAYTKSVCAAAIHIWRDFNVRERAQ